MTFAGRMLEARRLKLEARNRGLSGGDFRGTVAPRRPDDLDAIELAVARVVSAAFDWQEAFANDLSWIVRELNDDTLADLAATF
jgi:hypothetical protein